MSKLIVYFGDNPECIEGFSPSCSRSVDGALHLKPRKPITVTNDEFQHIMGNRADLKSKIRVVADKPEQKLADPEKGPPAEVLVEKPAPEEKFEVKEQPLEVDLSGSGKKKKF